MFKKHYSKILFLLFIAGIVNYLDRAAFSVAMPYIKDHLHLSPTEVGVMLSSFFFGYALFNFVGGHLSDIYGPRKVFAIAMVSWSLFCGLTGLAFGYGMLFVVRLLFGMSEGPISTTINKCISNWVPLSQRSRAVGIANAGNPLGGAIAGPIVGIIAVMWNWRISFIILMVLGFVWTFFWLRSFTDRPHSNPHTSAQEVSEYDEEQQTLLAGQGDRHKLPLRFYLAQPIVLFTGLAFFSINYILYFFLTWFPSYLSMERGLNIKEISIASAIPWLIGSVGIAIGGATSDWIFRKTHNLLFSRKIMLVGGLILSAICLSFAGSVTSVNSAVSLMALGIFFMYFSAAAPWSIISEHISPDKVGGVGGFVHLMANTSGMIAPILTGVIVQYTGSFIAAFILAGAVGVVGALGVALFVKPIPGGIVNGSLIHDNR
ncbi:MFS transporter [Sodalis ligni]|uniref:ACS family hexuronate transporter-like MFS transporter n=1 Tax=Sodalis ligni TaxID=2697027 RepID=A0A4R1NBZ3_9GAMM|nr:MFS transporter [Sodalis ligni]QWA12272.1 MFS transporter [Sodalis ligni]TCL04317.1 ACS family hexuronate transporter-like MFS transporter [Sodalis ligni]